MKKIISVLALGTLVFGSAAAKKQVNLNYRNGASLWSYTNNGETADEKFKTKKNEGMNFFDLNKLNGGKDTLQFRASGDVLSFNLNINPGVTNVVSMKALEVDAVWGAFRVAGGLNGDGRTFNFRVKKDVDAGNWDGNLFERYKLGSMFKGSYANYSDNQIGIGGADGLNTADKGNGLNIQGNELFAQAAFTIAVPNSDASFQLVGTMITPRAWKNSNEGKNGEYNSGAGDGKNTHSGHIAWTAFALFEKPSVFKAQAFVKANPHCAECPAHQVFVPGAYFDLLAVKNLEAVAGASMSIVESTVQDYNFDIRARYAFNSAFSLTYYWNLSVLNGDVATTTELGGEVGTFGYGWLDDVNGKVQALKTNIAMWNNLHARFMLNDTFTATLDVGAISDLGNGINVGPQKAEGTELSVTPAVQIYAAKNASIVVGFNATFRGIGKEEHPVNDTKGDETATQQGVDLGFAIPVLFRVKM